MYNQECQTTSSGFRYDSPACGSDPAHNHAASTVQHNLDCLEKSVAMLRESLSELYDKLSPVMNPEGPMTGCGSDKAIASECPIVDRIRTISGIIHETTATITRTRGRLAL